MKITWLGHATLVLEIDGARLITDPVLRNRLGPLVRISKPPETSAFGSIDAVLLSHLHGDHADPRSLRAVGRAVPTLAPSGAGRWLRSKGFRCVTELGAGEEARAAGVRVRATHATHHGRRWPLGPTADSIGYVIGVSPSV
jgi:L-ascorbate metabolism protein UlaG (beta-lactamase superfamily)